jgi:hypothetical protein
MRWHYSLKHSNEILRLLRKELGRNGNGVTIEAWANCREQGYCLKVWPMGLDADRATGICFAQERSGDSIVVVSGPIRSFNNQTNQPSDELCRNRRGFSDDGEAARYIAAQVLKTIEPVAASLMGVDDAIVEKKK